MGKIKIVTDSTVDMTKEELDFYDIKMVPLSIAIDGETYLDKIEIDQEEFLNKMKHSAELPKSSQPSAGTLAEIYDEIGKDGSEVISIHMTGGMSGTVRSAECAADMSKTEVTVFDSQFISKAMSFQVIEAAKMARAGSSKEDILARLENIRENTRLIIVIDNLENLRKGGRIGKLSGLIGSILKLKPIAILKGGVLHLELKARSESQILKFIRKKSDEDLDGKKVGGMGIVHANGYSLAEKVRQFISEKTGIRDIKIEGTTPVVSTHTGEGAIALMYYWN
ncbi:DegV family protein [Bacillus massiliglaciei]|uniref:DegV family protein n=1 Tax=Bacillus massiliglaciei TaxID=1816693 RepID=UPI000A60A790|nr:DegV family protein [Bacillus massiliglaciei]